MSTAEDIPKEEVTDKIDSYLTRQEEELTCPVCRNIFEHPVILPCSHSFCKSCMQQWWTVKPSHSKACPVCKTNSYLDQPPINLALKNLCENFLEERSHRCMSEVLCPLHDEKLRLFCLDNEHLACLVCQDSEKHAGHKFRPIYESAKHLKEDLQESLKALEEKLEDLKEIKAGYHQTAEYIKVQAQHTEMQIKKQFKNIRDYLRQEEKARITVLREEEKEKSQMLMEKIEDLCREIVTLSNTIRDVEADDISFLQSYKTTVEKVQRTLPDPPADSKVVMDMAKHLGNLTFRTWVKMKEIVSYTPVILDPNTGFTGFILSDDLTSLLYNEDVREELYTNPDSLNVVQGSEGYNSGTHSWDIEVGNNNFWELGVLEESFQINNGVSGLIWCIGFRDGTYDTATAAGSGTRLSVKQKLWRIRVQLDWNRGELSFSDPDTNTHVHTFTHTFTEKLFPFITTNHHLPLRVLPEKVCVTLAHDQGRTGHRSYRDFSRWAETAWAARGS